MKRLLFMMTVLAILMTAAWGLARTTAPPGTLGASNTEETLLIQVADHSTTIIIVACGLESPVNENASLSITITPRPEELWCGTFAQPRFTTPEGSRAMTKTETISPAAIARSEELTITTDQNANLTNDKQGVSGFPAATVIRYHSPPQMTVAASSKISTSSSPCSWTAVFPPGTVATPLLC